jgi:hypothetical protein
MNKNNRGDWYDHVLTTDALQYWQIFQTQKCKFQGNKYCWPIKAKNHWFRILTTEMIKLYNFPLEYIFLTFGYQMLF